MYNPRTQPSNTYDQTHSTHLANNESSTNLPNDNHEPLQFRPIINQNQESVESDDSGVCSPPLWKSGAATPSPPRSPSQPLLSHHVHRSLLLSPNSRTQAIVRGQRELMEMVKNMPESSYELSLKDLVEYNKINQNNQAQQQEFEKANQNQNLQQRGVTVIKRQESKRLEKNLSFENQKGLFLKMGFPFSWGFVKKKKFGGVGSNSGRVSPKPEAVKGGGGGGGEREWWKKKFTGSSDSDSSRTSDTSGGGTTVSGGRSYGGGGGRKKDGFLSSCCSFYRSKRSKSEE